MTFLAPLGLLAGLLAMPVIAMHILRPHRDPTPVSSTYLWQEAEEPVAAAQPWQRLRWTLPLVLQLLIVALLALALARPAWPTTTTLAEHTVFIVDASASMSATDERPDRVAAAKERVAELFDQLPDDAAASLVIADATPEVVVAETTDATLFERELDRVRPTFGVADFDLAFTLAESLVSSARPTGWVLVSDGGLTDDEQRLAPPGTQYEAIGSAAVNRAVTSLSVTGIDGQLTAVVTVRNTGGPEAEQTLRIDVDGVTVERRDIVLGVDETLELSVPIPPGSRVEALLDGDDLQPVDNRRVALAPLVDDVRVRIESAASTDSFFVTQALDAMGVNIVDDPSADVDLVVYDGVDAPAEPATPFVSINSPVPPLGLSASGAVERPIPTFLADEPILDGIDITRTAIARAQDLTVDAGQILIGGANGEPLVVAGRTGSAGWFHVGFRLEESNLPVSVAYPILFTRMVAALTIADEVPGTIQLGERLPSLTTDATVTSPRGVQVEVPAGSRMPVVDRTGFWTVEDPDGSLRPVAAVFPVRETDLSVADVLTEVPAATLEAADAASRSSSTSLLPWVLAAVLVVLAVELAVGWRRAGVGRRQRIAGLAVRTAIVVAVVLALADIGIDRTNDDVRAVLVLDVSDSLHAEGRERVEGFRRSALADVAADRFAIVEVGATAHVAAPFGQADDVTVDDPPTDGTDLVRGLRLASSLLDASTRERIVIVSDGRDTTGGLNDEIARLAEIGIEVDVHQLDPAIVADVAVVSVSAPAAVSEDEQYRLVADVETTQARSAMIELVRNGQPEASRVVDLAVGSNEVEFEVTATSAGVDRYAIRVVDATDAVPENDVAVTAVGVEGPPRVLVVGADDGDDDGDGTRLVDALASRAVDVEHRVVTEFPAADELLTYTSVVLVDLEVAELGPDNTGSIDTFVRDRGGGLIVVGGRSSFALGGYADSDLEALLPVESRAEDPTRKATVAEVLLIDASESMGQCHCAPVGEGDDPFGGGMIEEGGVNKTDISRAAASRAASVLSGQDELGVLAFNGTTDWVVPLQLVSDIDDIDAELARLQPSGETRIEPALRAAADELLTSDRELKHIVLFSDGFTPELVEEGFFEPGVGGDASELADLATELNDDGITVSVVATGEGAAPLLEEIAINGGGRFYPGRDLEEIPEIFVEEARIASRSFINEGSFAPTITSAAAPVSGLVESPPISGYVATTPKSTADVMLQVGDFADPLLASWRIGLGKVTTWTSDGGERWSADWAGWDGWADFWSNVVRDTFPLDGAEGYQLRTQFTAGGLRLELASESAWPAGTQPVASVSSPDGTTFDVELARVDESHFEATVPARDTGSYAVSVTSADGAGSSTRFASAVASRPYSIEYRPPSSPAPDLTVMSRATGGRGQITAAQVFDPGDLPPGRSEWKPRWWLLLFAALAWPVDIALRRIQFSLLIDEIRARRRARR